jgi:hypothetical protein
MAEKRLPGLKRGTTFTVQLDYSYGGVAEVFAASNLSAQVRTRNNSLISNLTITADATVAGRFFASATSAQTANWPIGDVYFDVKRITNGVSTLTDTLVMAVAQTVTE